MVNGIRNELIIAINDQWKIQRYQLHDQREFKALIMAKSTFSL